MAVSYLDQLEQMLNADYRIVTMETYDVSRVQDLFVQITRFSNKAFYSWHPDEGMHRIGASHITIPRTQSIEDLLKHIHNSKHFGVYILNGMTDELKNESIVEEFEKLAKSAIPKVVILLGEYVYLPKKLRPLTLRSKHQMKKAG